MTIIKQGSEKATLRYSENFKQKIVKEIEEGKINVHEASKRYNIKGGSTIAGILKHLKKKLTSALSLSIDKYVRGMNTDKLQTSKKLTISNLCHFLKVS